MTDDRPVVSVSEVPPSERFALAASLARCWSACRCPQQTRKSFAFSIRTKSTEKVLTSHELLRNTYDMQRAFAYLRVSGKGQIEGDGFPRQLEAIKSYAAQHGIKVVKVFQEKGVCGATEWEDRPAWAEMIQGLNGVRTILIERLDRLARELFVQEYILRDLKARGVTLIPVREEDIDSNPERILFRQIMGAIAQYDKTMVVMKLRAARNRMKARMGRCEGRKPFGTRPGETEVIARMEALRAEGLPFDAIAARLNAEAVRTRTAGKQWSGRVVNRILRAAEQPKARGR